MFLAFDLVGVKSSFPRNALWQKLVFVTASAITCMTRRTAVVGLLGSWTAMPVDVTPEFARKLRRNDHNGVEAGPVRLCAITKSRCAPGTNLSNPSPEMTKVQRFEILLVIILNGIPIVSPCRSHGPVLLQPAQWMLVPQTQSEGATDCTSSLQTDPNISPLRCTGAHTVLVCCRMMTAGWLRSTSLSCYAVFPLVLLVDTFIGAHPHHRHA